MMRLITLFQTTQNTDRRCFVRFIYHHFLESSLQCLIGLEIFLVFVQRSSTDSPQVSSCQSRLQNIRCIHGAATLPGSYQRVNLIDKENDLTCCGYNFVDNAFESLLKLTLVFGTRNQGTHIKGVDLFLLQILRNIASHDTMGKSFGDRRLTDTRFTDQNRIILRTPRENLQHTPNLVISTDDGI